MNVSVITDTQIDKTSLPATPPARSEGVAVDVPVVSDTVFRLGLWLSGLQSFLQIRNYAFADGNRSKASKREWTKEFYLTNSALLLCSKLTLQLSKAIERRETAADSDKEASVYEHASEFAFEEVSRLSMILKNALLLNEAMLRSAPLNFSEWTAWSNTLCDNLKDAEIVQKVISTAERDGEKFLPATLQNLLQTRPIPFSMEADLRIVLPRIAKILKWLDVIGQMLINDEPLKPCLLLFSRIYEQTQEMLKYINNRLRRFTDENDPVFAALDCAVYAASIESRKVFNFELAGLTEIRQTPRVYAKIETAHGLLNDSFQQTIVNFAQLVEPDIDPKRLFPNFQTKLEQSLALRSNMWSIQQTVRKAEHHFDESSQEKLHQKLNDFVKGNMRFLMFKDCETVERFVEEILRTQSKNDLVPILHRFGAYLETLLGQVNMRVVLSNHPFDYPKDVE